MSKNYMPEVARMLGVEIGEPFDVFDDEGAPIWLLHYLLCGKNTLQKRPWRPKEGDSFFYVLTNGEIQKYVFEIDNIHTLMLFSFGNCFPTEEAAEAAVPEMMAKFEEIKKGGRE